MRLLTPLLVGQTDDNFTLRLGIFINALQNTEKKSNFIKKYKQTKNDVLIFKN